MTLDDLSLADVAIGLFVLFFLGSMARGQGLYWGARWLTDRVMARGRPESGWPLRFHQWLHADGVTRGRAALARWGWPLVPFAYLTVGFQSMVMAAAGMVRMRWWVFTLAQVPGALAWSLIYNTIGFAVWGAAFAAAGGSPGAWAVIVVVVVLLVLALRHRNRSRAVAQPHGDAEHQQPGHGEPGPDQGR